MIVGHSKCLICSRVLYLNGYHNDVPLHRRGLRLVRYQLVEWVGQSGFSGLGAVRLGKHAMSYCYTLISR